MQYLLIMPSVGILCAIPCAISIYACVVYGKVLVDCWVFSLISQVNEIVRNFIKPESAGTAVSKEMLLMSKQILAVWVF